MTKRVTRPRRLPSVTALLVLLLVSGCAPMRLTDTWRDSSVAGSEYRKIMTVALTGRADLRQFLEDEFVRQLRARGFESVACYTCIPDVEKINRDELARLSQLMKIDGFLIVRIERIGTAVDTYRASPPPGETLGRESLSDLVWSPREPDLTRKSESAALEARFYDGRTARLAWRGTAESVHPLGNERVLGRFVTAVLRQLERENLLARP